MTPSRPQVDLSKFKRLDLTWHSHVTWVGFKQPRIVFSISLWYQSPRPHNGIVADRLNIILCGYCQSFLFHLLETDKLESFCVVISYFTGHCSLNCCVRICTCVKKENQIALVAQKGLQECCNSNCVCHLDAVWQTLLNNNFLWSDTFTFTHNRLCGMFNDERYQVMRLIRTNQFSQFCKWLENLLPFTDNKSVILS